MLRRPQCDNCEKPALHVHMKLVKVEGGYEEGARYYKCNDHIRRLYL